MMTTQAEALLQINDSGEASSQRLAVLAVLKAARRPLIRWEVAKMAGIRETSACGRLRELEQAGAIVKDAPRHNPFSDKANVTYRLARPGETFAAVPDDQLDLFGCAA